jgi:hypothetical protein
MSTTKEVKSKSLGELQEASIKATLLFRKAQEDFVKAQENLKVRQNQHVTAILQLNDEFAKVRRECEVAPLGSL